jgi:hypothetical protein
MEYVLIISTQSDVSTTKVIDWLRYYKQPYIVINENTNAYLKEFLQLSIK